MFRTSTITCCFPRLDMQDAEQRVSVHMTLWLSEAILDTNLGKEPQSRAPGKDQGSHKGLHGYKSRAAVTGNEGKEAGYPHFRPGIP
jgi:hypothetical protein